ncbi:MAG: serine hydrolase [Gemmatimonadota bacterium]
MTDENDDQRLAADIDAIAEAAGADLVAVEFHDYETEHAFSHKGDEWFHAASTIKVPVLVGVYAAIDAGVLRRDSRVHVRNRFLSAADGRAYRLESARDAGASLHQQIGKTMRVEDLARQMIVTSSNLATNLLVELIGLQDLTETLAGLGVEGVELRRGVEDERAYQEDISNRVTARGLVSVLRRIEEGALSEDSSEAMLEILHDQAFRSGIPAGLPDSARVANKTGEISTVAHDTGLVYLEDRQPYALAILTRWDPSATSGRRDTLAAISRAVYVHLTGADADA